MAGISIFIVLSTLGISSNRALEKCQRDFCVIPDCCDVITIESLTADEKSAENSFTAVAATTDEHSPLLSIHTNRPVDLNEIRNRIVDTDFSYMERDLLNILSQETHSFRIALQLFIHNGTDDYRAAV